MELLGQFAPTVLLVARDPQLRRVVGGKLRRKQFGVRTASQRDAARALQAADADVVVVGLDMVSPDGGSLFDAIRHATDAYVIGIADHGTEQERVRALQAGADDVVSTPLSSDELVARCQALLRRSRHVMHAPLAGHGSTRIGPLHIDAARREVRLHGTKVTTTRIEFALLEHMSQQPEQVCSRTQLLQEVWGATWSGDDHIVDVHVSNLRRKLQRIAPGLRIIDTVRGIGFRLCSTLTEEPRRIELRSV